MEHHKHTGSGMGPHRLIDPDSDKKEHVMRTDTSASPRMPRIQPGASPGTLIAHPGAERPRIHLISYSSSDLVEADITDPASIADHVTKYPVTWIDVHGVGHAETVHELGQALNLHKLALEDVVNLGQRPKVEEYDDHLFIVARMIETDETVWTEQLSICLGERFVLTFQEHSGDCFDPVRKRIRECRGRVRSAGPDYLAYCILDAVVDAYFPHLDEISERLEKLESRVLSTPTPETVAAIHQAKRDLIEIRHATAPLRDAINMLLREAAPWISEATHVYLRDCYDHIVRISEAVDTHREVTGGLLDVYLSSVSNRMNEIMKVLTIIATMFIPLSFLAGLYGMNFDAEVSPWNMPELRWYWGYPAFLLAIAAIALLELYFFWHWGWIGARREKKKRKT